MSKYLPILLLSFLTLSSDVPLKPKYFSQSTALGKIEVPAGKIGYATKEELVSKDYTLCSALILNGNKGSTLAHVYPSSGICDFVDSTQVVKASLDILLANKNSTKTVEAILIAGNSRDYQIITEELQKHGIKLVKTQTVDHTKNARHIGNVFAVGARDITYNPITQDINVMENIISWKN